MIQKFVQEIQEIPGRWQACYETREVEEREGIPFIAFVDLSIIWSRQRENSIINDFSDSSNGR